MLTRAERLAGGLWGMLVGDALGVPYEFHRPEDLPPREAIEMAPPAGFRRAHASVPPATWSDDGAQALALLASLLDAGRLDVEDLGRRIVAWHDRGYMAVGGVVFDVGIQTGQAIQALKAGAPALTSGPAHEQANGNGSLMRVLPLALWHRGTDAELVRDAQLQSVVTHGNARAQACCALYCLWARRTLAGASDPWAESTAALREIYRGDEARSRELEWSIRPDDPPAGTGSGYVVDCLRSARLAMLEGSYEEVVRAAVALGHDTDTTACVAGGVAGLRWGAGAIPERWASAMRGREVVEPLLARLLEVAG